MKHMIMKEKEGDVIIDSSDVGLVSFFFSRSVSDKTEKGSKRRERRVYLNGFEFKNWFKVSAHPLILH
jgi:hypothetical protein